MSQGKKLSLKFKHFLVIESSQEQSREHCLQMPCRRVSEEGSRIQPTGLILPARPCTHTLLLETASPLKERQSCSLESTLASWTVWLITCQSHYSAISEAGSRWACVSPFVRLLRTPPSEHPGLDHWVMRDTDTWAQAVPAEPSKLPRGKRWQVNAIGTCLR